MLRTTSKRLASGSTSGVSLLGLLIFLAFMILVLPRQASAGDPAQAASASPDLSFYYSPADLHRMAASYGEQGRAEFVRSHWTFDLVWPLVYTFFLVTAISWLGERGFSPGSRWRMLNLLPLAAIFFDYAENAATSLVMLRFPLRLPLIEMLASISTPAKWIMVVMSFAALFAALIGWLLARARHARRA